MKIGIMAGATAGPDATLDGLARRAKELEAKGFPNMWMANIFGLDAINALSIVGRETSSIEVGTAVVPTYPRHPVAIAQQALTAAAACEGRFTLGIGLSHKIVIEDMLGFSYDKPARHMREYLSVLAPLLRGEAATFDGEQYKVNAALDVSDAPKPVPLVVAALGPAMLRLAGEFSDGTITWMTGPATLEGHTIPSISKAAEEAGRPAPRIVAGFPIALTNDVDGAKKLISQDLAIYGQLPSYRAMLDREGADGPADIALVGGENVLDAEIERLRDIGVTDFDAAIVDTGDGAGARTLDYLASKI